MFQSDLFFFFQSNLDKWYILVFGILLSGSTLEEFSNTGARQTSSSFIVVKKSNCSPSLELMVLLFFTEQVEVLQYPHHVPWPICEHLCLYSLLSLLQLKWALCAHMHMCTRLSRLSPTQWNCSSSFSLSLSLSACSCLTRSFQSAYRHC